MVFGTGRVRTRVAHLLQQRYTRIEHIDILDSPNNTGDGLDEYGEPINVFAPPMPNQPCMFMDGRATLMRQDDGSIGVVTPTLYVLYEDPLDANDVIENVTDREGHVLVLSAVVDTSSQFTLPGTLVYRTVTLRQMTLP